MPGPLSRAAAGASYSGAFGSDAGDLAKAAAAFMQGRKQEETARQQQAMQDALLALRQREADQGDRRIGLDEQKFGEDQRQFDVGTGLTRERMGQDDRQFGQRLDFDKGELGQRATEGAANRASAEKIAGINARSRENVAGMRQVGSGRDFVTFQDSQGGYWRYDKVHNALTPIQTPTAADLASGQGDGTQAPGSGQQLLGPGARADQGEKGAAASYQNLQTQFDKYKEVLGQVGNQPPGIGTQFLMDQTKASGLGPISSLQRSLSNTVLGNTAPDYQLVQQAVDALGTSVIKMVTGAQMSEPEAQRIMNILRTTAGDTPEKVMQNLETVQNIINSERVKLGRAANVDANGMPATSRALPGATPTAPSAPRKQYRLPDGTVVE